MSVRRHDQLRCGEVCLGDIFFAIFATSAISGGRSIVASGLAHVILTG